MPSWNIGQHELKKCNMIGVIITFFNYFTKFFFKDTVAQDYFYTKTFKSSVRRFYHLYIYSMQLSILNITMNHDLQFANQSCCSFSTHLLIFCLFISIQQCTSFLTTKAEILKEEVMKNFCNEKIQKFYFSSVQTHFYNIIYIMYPYFCILTIHTMLTISTC